jgi:hypothetical protein
MGRKEVRFLDPKINKLRSALGKSRSEQIQEKPEFDVKARIGAVFLEEIANARSPRNLSDSNRQKTQTLAFDRPAPVC